MRFVKFEDRGLSYKDLAGLAIRMSKSLRED